MHPPVILRYSKGLETSNNVLKSSRTRQTMEASSRATESITPSKSNLFAWLQAVGSFALFFNSWGTVNTFGVFQTYYQTIRLSDSPSAISWIGSIQSFLLLLIGVLTGPLYDFGYFRPLICAGSVLVVFGLMMTSISTQYWHVLLSQGIIVGLGAGCIYIPSIAILPQYFTSNRAVAIGIASAGSSTGGVIYPIVFRQLQPSIGFAWATRTLALVSLITTGFAALIMRTQQLQTPSQRRSLLELRAFSETPYTLFCVAQFFAYLGFFVPVYYLSVYAIKKNAMNEDLAFYLVSILNAASIPGRIVPNVIASRFGALTVIAPAALASGILSLGWIGIHGSSSLIAFAVLYGFFSGGLVSLQGVALTILTPDPGRRGTRMGMCSIIGSVGSLCGTPIAGACLRGDNYLGVQLFSGLALVTCGLFLLMAGFCKGRENSAP